MSEPETKRRSWIDAALEQIEELRQEMLEELTQPVEEDLEDFIN